MTREERNIKLKHLITCMKCEANGRECDANCPTQYDAGNMGEIIENLEAISEILEQQPCEDLINRKATTCRHGGHCEWVACDKCNHYEPDTLSQQPCENYISRQRVLEVLKNNRYRFNISQEGNCEGKVLWSENLIIDDACKEIEQLPSVTPKEKTGHWTRVTDKTGHLVWECGCGWKQRIFTNFCPDCGYHMFEPQESEDKEWQ